MDSGTEVKNLIASNPILEKIQLKTYGIEDKFIGYKLWEDLYKNIEEEIYDFLNI